MMRLYPVTAEGIRTRRGFFPWERIVCLRLRKGLFSGELLEFIDKEGVRGVFSMRKLRHRDPWDVIRRIYLSCTNLESVDYRIVEISHLAHLFGPYRPEVFDSRHIGTIQYFLLKLRIPLPDQLSSGPDACWRAKQQFLGLLQVGEDGLTVGTFLRKRLIPWQDVQRCSISLTRFPKNLLRPSRFIFICKNSKTFTLNAEDVPRPYSLAGLICRNAVPSSLDELLLRAGNVAALHGKRQPPLDLLYIEIDEHIMKEAERIWAAETPDSGCE